MLKKILLISCFAIILVLSSCRTKNSTEENIAEPSNPSSNSTFMQTAAPVAGDTIAIMKTNMGEMKFILFPDKVPETVKNFEFHAEKNYTNTIFHRIIKDFMIQGGDIEGKNGYGGYSYKGKGTSFNDEFDKDLSNIRGALSMANSGTNTNGSQFFIVEKGATFLDGKHAVFGQLYEGFEVLDKIAAVKTDYNDKPLEDVVIESVSISKY